MHHYTTIPNTNKAIIELLCGLTPKLETSWGELDAGMREVKI